MKLMMGKSKEKINDKSLEGVSGGNLGDKDWKKHIEITVNGAVTGPYKCRRCGADFYLGNEERPRAVCLSCRDKPIWSDLQKKPEATEK